MYHLITQGAAGTLAVQTDEEKFAIIEEPRIPGRRKQPRKVTILNPRETVELVATAQVWLDQQRKAGKLT